MANSTTSNGRPQTSRPDRRATASYGDLFPSNSQYRVLLARLRALGFGPGGPLRTVGLTSSKSREGVTTVACNLALYAASCHDLRVLLVDANHSKPALHRIFHVPPTPGLTDLVNGDARESDCIHEMSLRPLESLPGAIRRSFRRGKGLTRLVSRRRHDDPAPRLSVLPAGLNTPGMGCLYQTKKNEWLDRICAGFDLVFFDLPATSLANCRFKVSDLNGILFVLEAEATSDIDARKSLNSIREDGAQLMGVVFNKCRKHLPKWLDRKLGP